MTWEELQQIVKDRLIGVTPDQASQYVDNNVTDLASAKQHLKQLTLIVLYLANNSDLLLGIEE